MNTADIIKEMRVLPSIDPDFEIQRRVTFIQVMFKKCRSQAVSAGH